MFLFRLRFVYIRTAIYDLRTSGVEMPLLQLGTAHLVTKPGIDATAPPGFTGMLPERAYRQVEVALQNGMRAFDTALIYRSHGPIGAVLGDWWRHGRITRPDVWITTKVFHPDATHAAFGISHMPAMSTMTPDEVAAQTREHFETSLLQLGVGYVDLLLLHWPSGKGEGDEGTNRARRIAAWKVLEDVYSKGWARAIGVSNFAPKHVEQLLQDGAVVVPMVNQIEASVTQQYPDIVRYCLQHRIIPQAYSPFGRGLTNALPKELNGIIVAAKGSDKQQNSTNKNAGQVAIKYLLQLGYAVVYLSNSEDRMVSNADVFDFELSQADMKLLATLHRPDGGWGLPAPEELD